MQTYAAVNLHSNNGFLAIIDETDRVLKQRKLANRFELFVEELEPYRSTLQGVAVESTFNWYWLVDGLQRKDFPVVLVNTSAIQQYSGLKHSDDQYDARWLAHMMRLGILPKGYIYPREQRAVRDLLRKRATEERSYAPHHRPRGEFALHPAEDLHDPVELVLELADKDDAKTAEGSNEMHPG